MATSTIDVSSPNDDGEMKPRKWAKRHPASPASPAETVNAEALTRTGSMPQA